MIRASARLILDFPFFRLRLQPGKLQLQNTGEKMALYQIVSIARYERGFNLAQRAPRN